MVVDCRLTAGFLQTKADCYWREGCFRPKEEFRQTKDYCRKRDLHLKKDCHRMEDCFQKKDYHRKRDPLPRKDYRQKLDFLPKAEPSVTWSSSSLRSNNSPTHTLHTTAQLLAATPSIASARAPRFQLAS